MRYVIDGGMLLHRIPWTIGSSYKDICASYASFLSTYTSCTIVNVFDGYHCYSTKDMVHKVRVTREKWRNLNCSNITSKFSTELTVKKSQFLSNSGNKQRFIDLLSEYLEESEFTCLHAPADADVIICRIITPVITGVTTFESTSLPPTSAAALELSLRVNHQFETWLENDLQPTDLGWKLVKGQYVPATTQLPAAPSEILEIIHRNCKGGCKHHQCSCLKHNIAFGPACTN